MTTPKMPLSAVKCQYPPCQEATQGGPLCREHQEMANFVLAILPGLLGQLKLNGRSVTDILASVPNVKQPTLLGPGGTPLISIPTNGKGM